MNETDIRAKIAAKDASQARAKAIVEVSEDLEDAVKREVGRVVSEEMGKALDALVEAQQAIAEHPDKNPRVAILKWLNKLHNKLTLIRAAYGSGALPK